jgi:small subunit ribosomal protein S17
MITEQKKIRRQHTGEVVSDKMDKTIVVRIARKVAHPLYSKKITVSARYKVHDPKNEYHVGDRVIFEDCRPISRDKRWRVVGLAK